ncbi:MAG: hypothetical protein ABSE93_28145 [Terriglobia bacterium]
MAQVATYYSWGLLTGTPSTLDDFRSELKRFSRDQMVYLCSTINVFLRSWWRGAPEQTSHEVLLKIIFDEATAERFLRRSKEEQTHFVFHREQLLFIAKEAILCCPEVGAYPLGQPPGVLARLFLMASDHLYSPQPETTDFEQKVLNLLANLIPSLEYSAPPAFRNAMARSHLMYGRFADELKNDVDYVDISSRFRKLTYLTPDEFMGLCFGLLSKYTNATVQTFAANPASSLFLQEGYFQQTAIDNDKIRKFKKELSATPAEFKKVFERRPTGPSDFTLFRAKPLYSTGDQLFCIDPGFLAEKLETGPFWRTILSVSGKEARDSFVAFWGRVFERYVNWLMSESVGTGNKDNTFFPSPKYASDGSEVCDGLMLCGSDAVFMEYKGGVFRAESKYGGNPSKLRAEIEEKLIRNPEGKRKGIEQLAEAIRRTCQKEGPEEILGVDLSRVRRLFPLLILRDGIGDAPMMNAFLNHKFDAIPSLSRKTVRPKILTPLFCMAADTVEYVAAFLKDASLSDILDARYRGNKGMGNPFLATKNDILDSLGEKSSVVLENAFREFVEPLVKALFPNEAAMHGLPGPGSVGDSAQP